LKQELVKISSVTTGYENEATLKNITFSVFDFDFIGVIGPNGGGKTTLVKLIMGLIKPYSGQIGYHEVAKGKTLIGYLPQMNQIDKKFPITVKDVVLSGLMSENKIYYRFTKKDCERATNLLELTGIANLHKKPVGELSGGQLQRVFLCRALISSPRLLILDEPNTFVDNKFEYDLYEYLKILNQNMAIMLVTHDIGIVTTYVKTIACVNTYLHYHPSNQITEEQLSMYNCPVQLVTHGDLPHTVLSKHNHSDE